MSTLFLTHLRTRTCRARSVPSPDALPVLARRQYADWGLHAFGGAANETQWAAALQPSGHDDFGAYWDVQVGI